MKLFPSWSILGGMKRLLQVASIVLAILFVSAFAVAIWLQNDLWQSVRQATGASREGDVERRIRLVAVMPDPGTDPFYAQIAEGLSAAADKRRASLRFLTYRPGSSPLDTALASDAPAQLILSCADMGIHGLIVSVPDSPEVRAAIDACDLAGIPTITLEYDSPLSRRKSFVGTNSFQIGYTGANLVGSLRPEGGRAVLVLPGNGFMAAESRDSLRLGFMTAIRAFPKVKVLHVLTSPSSPLAGENLVRSIRFVDPSADTIILTTLTDSLGAAQAVIDMDLVGDIVLVGMADSEEGRNFVRNGVIQAALARNHGLAGEEVLDALTGFLHDGHTSAYIDPGIRILDSASFQRSRPGGPGR